MGEFSLVRLSKFRTGALALGLAAALPLAAPALARAPGDSFAPLVERVMEAVVNISVSQNVPASRGLPGPNAPPGLEDLFKDFFDRRGDGQNPGQGGPQQRRSNSLGSGFVIDASGIVITNNHVIGEANDITVNFSDGTKLKAEIVGKDAKTDLAVLRVKPDKPLKAVKFGKSTEARVGDWVMAIGNPFGFGGSVSVGIVSAHNRQIGSGPYDNFIQTDAAINKGNSGGPLFNMDGEVIGINTAIVSPTGGSIGIGFAVPSATALPVIDQLRQFGETRRGWLGVRIQEVDQDVADNLNLGRPRGALIAGVEEKGPAKAGGIETGDVIVKFDGKDIRASRDLPRMVAETPVGKDVLVDLVRKGKEMQISMKLGRLEDGEKQASAAPAPGRPGGGAETQALGLDLQPLTAELRRRFSIKEGLRGVVITRVDPNSKAAEKRIMAGEVIVEVAQEAVNTPAEVTKRIEDLRKDKKRSALLLVANPQGELRFVAVALD